MTRQQFLFSLAAIASSPVSASDDVEISLLTGKKLPILRFGLLYEVSTAFEKMKKEAKKEGVQLHITSAYRDFNRQTEIWNGKFDRYTAKGMRGEALIHKITEFSAMPGTSRHHWGTDADILDIAVLQPKNPLEPSHYVKPKGVYNRMYEWMLNNSEKFGFYEAYTDDAERTGYEFEPWHYSYKTVAKKYLLSYNQHVKFSHIKSPQLKGHELITEAFFQNYVKRYVNGVNQYLQVV